MEYGRYVARKRARFKSATNAQVNIPWGAVLEVEDGFLFWNGAPLCAAASQNAYDYFSQDDDGQGKQRGALVGAILTRLQTRNSQAQWDKVWDDALCQRYRRPEHEDHWIWSYDFYNAPVVDLWHIAKLVGAKV